MIYIYSFRLLCFMCFVVWFLVGKTYGKAHALFYGNHMDQQNWDGATRDLLENSMSWYAYYT